jgi:NitT/TauT family transport system permease protein
MINLDMNKRLHRLALQGVFGIFLIGIWILAHFYNPVAIPLPTKVASAFQTQVANGSLPTAMYNALYAIIAGYALAIVVGVGFGLLMGLDELTETFLDPYVSVIYVTPLSALVPALVLWFGTGLQVRVFAAFFLAVFAILINTLEGVKTTPKGLIEVAQSFNGSTYQVVRHVVIPHELPYVMAGLRLGINLAVKGLVVAEIVISVTGFGGIITQWGSAFRMEGVFSVVLTLMLLGIILTKILRLIESQLSHSSV